MKKIIISMMAVAALAACTKSEVQYDTPNEIGFAPVASNVTKSVAGYEGENFDGVFPTDVDLYVFANAVEGTYSTTNIGTPYFSNAQFEWKEDKGSEATQTIGDKSYATTGAYAGNPTRYWPNVKTLVFAGYSDACNAKDCEPSMDFSSNQLTIENYTQSNYTATVADGVTTYSYPAEGANDLMWFAYDGQQYSKQADEVAAKMQHACSWITINVKGDANMVSSACKLNGLKLQAFAHTGKVVCKAAEATWSDLTNNTTEDYYGPDAQVITDAFAKYENATNNFIVIPQTPVKLDVTYTYTSDANNGLTLTETKPVSLAFNGDAKWASGVHYIYNITITATEILIDPVVVDWTEYEDNEIEKEVN